jgi:hypothetical protein
LAAAPGPKGAEDGAEIGTDAAAGRLAGGKVTSPARQAADQTRRCAISICYAAALRRNFVESRWIAKILAVRLARRIEHIVAPLLILSTLYKFIASAEQMHDH